MNNITQTQLTALTEILNFVEAYVDYHIDDVNVIDGEPTDAQLLSQFLPQAKSIFDTKGKDIAENNAIAYGDVELKDIIYTERKHAAESVNPNYKYCVVSSNIDECYLTDSEVAAMEFAIKKSRIGNMWNVCEIKKSKCDGTYRTYIVGYASDGDYYESSSREFLHYNYIAESASVIGKI